jgi:hypothetical protein
MNRAICLTFGFILASAFTANAQTKTEEGGTNKTGCIDPVFAIFDNYNTDAVLNGGKAPSFDTRTRKPKSRYCLVQIETYHWNNAKGAAPGTLGLTDITNGANANVAPGPWPAAGSPGQGNVPNADWTANVGANPPVILDGEYTVKDSSPNTWSGNAKSLRNFARVFVKEYVEP